MEGRRRTRSFLEDDHEAEENIRQLALAASLNGATAKTRGSSSGNSSSSAGRAQRDGGGGDLGTRTLPLTPPLTMAAGVTSELDPYP